jgi:hypothetical protein
MRFTEQAPDNPWPQDMVIRVDETPHHLTILLFIRQAWGIAAEADVPRLDPLPDIGASRLPDSAGKSEWEARWHRAWARAWDWYTVEQPGLPTPEQIRAVSRPGQGLNPVIPPFWQADYGWAGIDLDAYNNWERQCSPHAYAPPRRSAAASPEPRSLPALIAAWEGGLDSVIVLPYAGYFARRITNRHLAVSAAARNDPESYSRALGTAEGPGLLPGADGP